MALSNHRAPDDPHGSHCDLGGSAPSFPTVFWSGDLPHAVPVARAGFKETRAPPKTGLFRVVLLRGRCIVGVRVAVARMNLTLGDRDKHRIAVLAHRPKMETGRLVGAG